MKYYLDTAIWIDMHENRTDRFRPLGEWAFELLRKIRKEKHTVVYSDILIDELLRKYSRQEIQKIFGIAQQLEKVITHKEQLKEAAKLCKYLKIPWGDCLHAILARDSGAIMVTRDRHFEQLHCIIKAKKPEDLL
jgi:predicted nucleic acid-binding protein